ncbi:MAG: histidine phosphatase family protein [Actinobacteria bacterium]|nr:histidine phosphatase family protein [Actinomycetota bacterium]MDQ4021460.1 histidine phosphatase family protein [Actinomycetota bacterium]HZA16551.1 histidine phosphatase family protein [Pseudonocardiaceae bacterium]
MTLTRLVLWRHGETDYNAALRMQGQLDSQLTATGLGQARRAARLLAELTPDVLVTSDLSRAGDTAAVLAAETGMPLRVDKRLRETNLGTWQGLTHAEVEARCPGGIQTWRGNPEWAPPGGETRVEVAGRAAHVVSELDADGHGSAVLCTHGGLIAGLTPLLLGLPVSGWSVFGGISNCHWTVLLRHGSGWRLFSYNTAAPV